MSGLLAIFISCVEFCYAAAAGVEEEEGHAFSAVTVEAGGGAPPEPGR